MAWSASGLERLALRSVMPGLLPAVQAMHLPASSTKRRLPLRLHVEDIDLDDEHEALEK